MTDSKHITLAFVGCGAIAQDHWRGIQTHAPQLKVTAAVDVDPARATAMAKQTGAQAFTSLEEALDQGNFEAVDIMLPHHLHEDATVRAFEARKHVVLEKPIAPTIASAERILEAAEKAGTVFMVAEQSQYWPAAVKVQQLLQAGAIGEIVTANAVFNEKIATVRGAKPWRYDKQLTGGGICIDGGLHKIRPLRMWLGEVAEVIAVLGYPIAAMEGESMAQALLRFTSGTVAHFEATVSQAISPPGEDFNITGTEGAIVVERYPNRRARLYNRQYPEGRDILAEDETSVIAYGLELADFARAILNGTELAAGPEASLNDLRVVLAMYRSAESGQWEKV